MTRCRRKRACGSRQIPNMSRVFQTAETCPLHRPPPPRRRPVSIPVLGRAVDNQIEPHPDGAKMVRAEQRVDHRHEAVTTRECGELVQAGHAKGRIHQRLEIQQASYLRPSWTRTPIVDATMSVAARVIDDRWSARPSWAAFPLAALALVTQVDGIGRGFMLRPPTIAAVERGMAPRAPPAHGHGDCFILLQGGRHSRAHRSRLPFAETKNPRSLARDVGQVSSKPAAGGRAPVPARPAAPALAPLGHPR